MIKSAVLHVILTSVISVYIAQVMKNLTPPDRYGLISSDSIACIDNLTPPSQRYELTFIATCST